VDRLTRPAAGALLLLPGLLTLYLGFEEGGYFAGSSALVALLLAVLLVLRITLAERPLAGLSGLSVAVIAALSLYAAWTLLSAVWSEAPGRALVEFERALMYTLAVVLFGSIPHSAARMAWMIRGVAVAIVAICAAALITRVLPDWWAISPTLSNDRLSFPLGYWNALGIVAAAGAILNLHLTSYGREPAVVRVLAAAALPIVACALLLTFSRGALAAGVVGFLVYVLLGHPRALLGALPATVPPVAVAAKAAYDADLLQASDYTTRAAIDQGQDLALVIGLAVAGAATLRTLTLWLDRRLEGVRRPSWLSPTAGRAAAAGAVAAVLVALVVAGAPGYVSRQYDRFVDRQSLDDSRNLRGRLTDPANNGRLAHWQVAVDAYQSQKLHGTGAGTYQLRWARDRPYAFAVVDGHSLYVEVLGELGLVGLALLAVALALLLFGQVRRVLRHRRHRALYAAVVALTVAWLLHAGVDWDWEMPAITLPVLCLGAMAIGARRGKRPLAVALPQTARAAIGLGLLALAVTPALTVRSQQQIDASLNAIRSGDCVKSVDASLNSIDALSMRPEPWELLGYCDMRLGRGELAVRAMQHAVSRDPSSWEVHYGLALAQAANGKHPRPELRPTLRLNPREPIARQAAVRFTPKSRRAWRERALRAPLPLPQDESR